MALFLSPKKGDLRMKKYKVADWSKLLTFISMVILLAVTILADIQLNSL